MLWHENLFRCRSSKDSVNFVNKVIKHDVEQVYFGANRPFKNWKDKWTDPMFDPSKNV